MTKKPAAGSTRLSRFWLLGALGALSVIALLVIVLLPRRPPISDVPTPGCEQLSGQPPVTTASPLPTFEPGVPIEIVVHARDYADVRMREPDLILDRGCAITVVTRRPDPSTMVLYYQLPDGLIPEGATIQRVDVRVCGMVEGDLWEVYGPYSADPVEYELSQPSAEDGCWHFENGTGKDTEVTLYIRHNTTWRIEAMHYTVTLAEDAG